LSLAISSVKYSSSASIMSKVPRKRKKDKLFRILM
jgi:hypothetical protein